MLSCMLLSVPNDNYDDNFTSYLKNSGGSEILFFFLIFDFWFSRFVRRGGFGRYSPP